MTSNTEQQTIRVVVSGAGKMAKLAISSLSQQPNIEVIGSINHKESENLNSVKSLFDIPTSTDPNILGAQGWNPDIVVDFSNKEWTRHLLEHTVNAQINTIIGTSGFQISQRIIMRLGDFRQETRPSIAVIPSFSIGITLFMRAVRVMSGIYTHAEIIEHHASSKKDSPSQTSLMLSEDLQANNKNKFKFEYSRQYNLKNEDSRGANSQGVPIHSVRTPSSTPKHEVILSSATELMTIKHESLTRESFVPGLVYSVNAMHGKKSVIITNLEALIFSQ